MRRPDGRRQEGWQMKVQSLNFVRYADDFVLMHRDKKVILDGKEVIEKWLSNIGLELKPSKTRIAHTLLPEESEDGKAGFDFLGFHICTFKVGYHSSMRLSTGKRPGIRTLITPTKEAYKKHQKKLSETIKNKKIEGQAELIENLNPIIKGWMNYYKTSDISTVGGSLNQDNDLYHKLRSWSRRRCKTDWKKAYTKYWNYVAIKGKKKKVKRFSSREVNGLYLTSHTDTSCSNKYVKVKGDASPFDGNLSYWATRMGRHPEMDNLKASLLKKQKGKCPRCGLYIRNEDIQETDHIIGVKALTPKQRLTLINKIALGSKVKPTRRVWIPKPGTEEKRPLGIPTMEDRALQALAKLGLEPEWEARFEVNSYGFRPGRSCHDAIGAIFCAVNKKSKYVLDADISKCFDRINHDALLQKINTYPTLRRQIRAWLKAGVMDGKELFPTTEGTPQGGVISPLLANVALHGMEELIMGLAPKFDMKRTDNTQLSVRDKLKSISCIRYADDFVVLHEDLEVIKLCKFEIEKWLSGIGLELKPSKTRISHTLNKLDNEKPGFNFLGFNVIQFPVGKYNSGRNRSGLLGYKTIITPNKESQKKHYRKVAEVINKSRGIDQATLIMKLNPIIRGWCNYFSTVVTQKVFERLWHLVVWKLLKWGRHRHRNKGRAWIRLKYFKTVEGNNWEFATRESKNPLILIQHSSTKITRYVKVKGNASPYDGNWLYWSSRMGVHPEVPVRVATLLKRQKGKCAHCGNFFKDEDVLEVDHIVPKSKGGKDKYDNWRLLHQHCHDTKTANDGSFGNKSNCNSVEPKPLVKSK